MIKVTLVMGRLRETSLRQINNKSKQKEPQLLWLFLLVSSSAL
ncbi:hypothetical protein VC0101557_13440 [Vibrio cholerae VC0101557]|uniref:Uncharacterized protein n=3 Tax=Vibrio cholerae TaxID=666 RepID=Q9KU22_VIBCH|nr:hypothetical protein VC_0707 [Vibrio cholerae O1 biovar El Tor str. N16961]ACP04987.1 conserved hypothetical protein [Vibrio cholerae M66-2]ACQ61771.1 hypothetical protein VCD_003615 [Vibrio cholerae MJ-1236]AEA77911.1 hypothetical protein VCLMA_A0626 [Vibrio cholerae LMA3984-4]AET25825.1 conserved hypothetical protein [Vibrio cholerae O1 str. 2010EL-1786]APF48309.1 hypothetical protein ASZ80_00750 [Vibrio cholerae]EAZ73343.1 hypothetical protein A5C_0730 [Vibrio cholerae NCTC 8457]EAZ769